MYVCVCLIMLHYVQINLATHFVYTNVVKNSDREKERERERERERKWDYGWLRLLFRPIDVDLAILFCPCMHS